MVKNKLFIVNEEFRNFLKDKGFKEVLQSPTCPVKYYNYANKFQLKLHIHDRTIQIFNSNGNSIAKGTRISEKRLNKLMSTDV